MAALGIALLFCFALGLLVAVAGGIFGLVDAFHVSLVWGLLYLFVPFASLVFVIKFWRRKWARNSFLMAISGSGLALVASLLLSVVLPTVLPETGISASSPYGESTDIYDDLTPTSSTLGSTDQTALGSEETSSSIAAPKPHFQDAVRFAIEASERTQSASTQAEWRMVATTWQEAIDAMKAVPPNDPNYETAQAKIAEYGRNLAYAQQNAG